MEDKEDEEIKEIVELLKEINKNNAQIKKNKIDPDIINKINDDEKIKYFKLNYTELYIVDKESIEKLLEELNYDELENLIEQNDGEELNEKLEKLFKDKNFSDLKDEIKNTIKIYNAEKEIDEIIKNQKKITFINEIILKSLEIPYKLYKEKEVFVGCRKYSTIIYFPKDKFSIFINSSSTPNLNTSISNIKVNNNQIQKEVSVFIPKTNQIKNINNNLANNMNIVDQNKLLNNNNNINNANNMIMTNIVMNNNLNDNNKNQINENRIDENINNINLQINNQFNNNNNNNNNNNIQINNNPNQFNNNNSQNNIQINMNNINVKFSETVNIINKAKNAKLKLDKNINIVTNHILFLNYINNNLPSMNMLNLDDISQIQNINYNNKLNIILLNSETFGIIGNNILYDECSLYLNLDMNNKQEKYNELLQKIGQNNYIINPSQIQLIKSFSDFNLNPNAQFMIVNEEFCANVGLDKQQFINSYLFLFKANNELFLFFNDVNKIMKVDKMNNYYKLNKNIGDMIDTPKDIVDNLINLYKESKIFNEYLTEYELNENSFKNYYIVNKNWIELYKQYYNYEDIYIKYEEICFNDEEEINNANNNNNINNFNQNKNNKPGGSNKKRKKNKKKNKNKNNINNSGNSNQKKVNNPTIISTHKNIEIPKLLLDENSIIPVIKIFKESFYPIDFELIENQTLKNICKSLNLDVNINIYEQITIEALVGNDTIILKRKDNSIVIYTVKGIKNILEYIIMFDDKNSMNNEINFIKSKGIEQYLIEKYLNFDDDSLQYLPNSENTSVVGKIYICNKKQIDYNLNNNKMYYRSTINLNNIVNNHQYINNFNYKILPARAGLNNIGATCYMNATLQCLCNIPTLQNFFLYNNNLYQKQSAILSKAFGDVMRNLYDRNKNKMSYSPNHFKDVISEMNPLFKGVAANDSKDLILFLLEKMHEELNTHINYNPEPNLSEDLLIFRKNYYTYNCSIFQKIFIHEMESTIKCCNCGFETYNYSAHNFVIFPLEKIRQQKILTHPQGFYLVTLEDCFEKQQAVDYLQGDSMIYCNGCKKLCVAENVNRMNTCPDILIIILNRGKGNVFEVDFDFPMRFDLYNYVNEKNKNTQYELISVIVHTGGNDMSGHFYSYCKSNIDKKWYRYNDSLVDMLDDNYQITIKNYGLPYVLFYQNTNICNNENNMINLNNNISNGQITLYFKLIDYDKELYLDVNSNDIFSIVIQKLAQKYNDGSYNFFNCIYYILMMNQKLFIDFQKTVQQNNLSDSSFVIIEFNK